VVAAKARVIADLWTMHWACGRRDASV